eukprot:gene11774-23384_t
MRIPPQSRAVVAEWAERELALEPLCPADPTAKG